MRELPARSRRLSSIAGTTRVNALLVSAGLVATSILGAAQALLLAFLVDDEPARDAFFAAYAVYLPLAVLAASMRTSLVPLLAERNLDDDDFPAQASSVLAACALAGLAIATAIASATPLLRATLASGLDESARDSFVVVLLILVAATYLHIHSALLSAVLVKARNFRFSAFWYPVSGLVGLALSASLLPLVGVAGAALGVLGGALVLATAHTIELRGYGVHVRPYTALRTPRVALRRGTYLVGNAALGWSTMLGLAIALTALPDSDGTITAYSYAFFLVLLLLNVTSLPIGLVKLPDLVELAGEGGPAAVRSQLVRVHVLALVLLAPLVVSLLTFGGPLLRGIFSESLGTGTATLLAQLTAILCALALGSLVLQLCHSGAIAMGRWRTSLTSCLAGVVAFALVLAVAGALGTLTVAALHSAATAATALLLTGLLFRGGALSFAAAVTRGAAPAVGLAAVCALPRLVTGPDPGIPVALLGALAGLVAYAVLIRLLCRDLTAPFAAGVRNPASVR